MTRKRVVPDMQTLLAVLGQIKLEEAVAVNANVPADFTKLCE